MASPTKLEKGVVIGNFDNWDPLLVDTIAAHREVILLDNTGVGFSSGTVPFIVTEIARDAIAFLDARGDVAGLEA